MKIKNFLSEYELCNNFSEQEGCQLRDFVRCYERYPSKTSLRMFIDVYERQLRCCNMILSFSQRSLLMLFVDSYESKKHEVVMANEKSSYSKITRVKGDNFSGTAGINMSHVTKIMIGDTEYSFENRMKLAIKPKPFWIPSKVWEWVLSQLLILKMFE
jgi:hypothetical protein